MSDEPSGTDAEEMIYCVRGIVRLLQFLLQRREGILPKTFMYVLVLVKPLIINGSHICFLVCEMF